MKAGGIPPENIITMMYNDVPFDLYNPFPGRLYNKPGDDAIDYYKGVLIDYQKGDVTKENLIKVLTGVKSTGKKVLKSTSEDNVFLFYSDHGARDLLGMPNSDNLYSDELLGAIKTMHSKGMYKKFVLYVEACFSGSMFLNFPEDLNVVAVTAANEKESSYAVYCPGEGLVHHVDMGTCLGDEFSVGWMEDADLGDNEQTLKQQFDYLVKKVQMSHVSQYGDVSYQSDRLSDFIGVRNVTAKASSNAEKPTIRYDSRDNEMLRLRYMMEHCSEADRPRWTELYNEEMKHRELVDLYIRSIAPSAHLFGTAKPVKNFKCYKAGIKKFESVIGKSDYAMKYYDVIANICAENPHAF